MYYKLMTIIKGDSRVVNKLETSLTDDARVIICDHRMFIAQAPIKLSRKLGRFIVVGYFVNY
jgi:hypothetical protein